MEIVSEAYNFTGAYSYSLPLLHVGFCDVQLPELPQVLVDDPDKEYPEVQEKVATVPIGYLISNE